MCLRVHARRWIERMCRPLHPSRGGTRRANRKGTSPSGGSMSSTRLLLLGGFVACIVTACGDGHPYGHRGDDSSIVFGISQKMEGGKVVETRAGYEFLELANYRGGWQTQVSYDAKS